MRIGIIAGELSGDQLGFSLVKKLKELYPNSIIEGIGGPKMIENGFNSLYPMDILSVIGLFEILSKALQIFKLRRNIINHFKVNKPDIFIGIDAPDFNLGIEKVLRKLGIKTIHYVSPKIWAWREYRIKKVKQATDTLLAIFPFEEEYYKNNHNFKSTFVGHPLAKAIPIVFNNRDKYRKIFGFNSSDTIPILSILPGSRYNEVKKLLPLLLSAIKKLKDDGYIFHKIMPLAKSSLSTIFDKYKKQIDSLDIKVYEGRSHEILKASNFCLLASGTATLEAMLFKLPMVVVYKVSKILAFIARLLVNNHSYFAFPNIFYKDEIVKELIQENCTVENIYLELKRLFQDKERNAFIIKNFKVIHQGMIIDTNEKILLELKPFLEKY